METAARIAHMLVRITGVLLLALGLAIWAGMDGLVPVHMLIGFVLVLALWTLAITAGQAGVGTGLVVLALAWGAVLPVLGLTQHQLLPGDAHVVVQVVHLLLGVGAVGVGEALAARMARSGRSETAAS